MGVGHLALQKAGPVRRNEIIRILKENGFFFLRNSKHEIYSDGRTLIPVPHCNQIERRLAKFIQIQIKKAIALRQSVQQGRQTA